MPEEPLDASVDRDKLRQILDALVDNAVKYSPAGATVTLAARRRPDAVELRVTDEGIGIAPDEHERIFRKFYRSADATSGSGLGLFIVQGLVARDGRTDLGRLGFRPGRELRVRAAGRARALPRGSYGWPTGPTGIRADCDARACNR